jgi:hypothetical protein
MPTITISISAGQNTVGRTKQITGPDLQNRFIPAHRAMFQMTHLSTDPAMTDDQVIQQWADDILQRVKQRILEYERSTAAIPPVDLT